jgi:hypothetical protein
MFFQQGGMPFMFAGGGMPPGFPGGMPGFPGGGDEGPRGAPPNTTRFYELLGVAKDASPTEIKKAFMLLAKKVRAGRARGGGAC